MAIIGSHKKFIVDTTAERDNLVSQVDPGSSVAIYGEDIEGLEVYVKSERIFYKFVDGAYRIISGGITNHSTVAQTPAATVRTYIVGSNLRTSSTYQIGSKFRWTFSMTKTAAGVDASTFDICFGTNGTTADTARVSFTKPAGTADADEGKVVIECTIRGPLSSAGIAVGNFTLMHNGNIVGHATIPIVCVTTVSAGFDVTTANLQVGVCITTGAADVITIEQVLAEAWNI